MTNKAYLLLSATLFGVVALLHLARVLSGVTLEVGGDSIPMAVSWCAVLLAGMMSAWGFRRASRESP